MNSQDYWGLRRFEGKTVIVTGGASGIGRATAQRLAAEGAKVWIADLPKDEEVALKAQGEGLTLIEMDVADPAAVKAAIDCIYASDGRIDVLVNGAGIVAQASLQETSPEIWNRILGVNLTGVFLTSRYVMPIMIEQGFGAIVNVASDAGLIGQKDQAAYCASKGGVVHLTRAAALDGAPYNIRVNCVCPCFIDTPLMRFWVASQPNPDEALRAINAEQPIGRVGQPLEIAAAIAFLASSEAAFVTGIALSVDGGTTAQCGNFSE
jgi:meso-butanediol dehydrogenase/(S,S)-butanediol dehydrogenase/diacetyl reductase